MQRILLFLLLSAPSFLLAQAGMDTTIKLDLLRSPASPAFNILGIAPSIIERPTDLTSFSLSVQQATNNFTTLPNSYALQLAPFLLSRKKFTLNTFDSNRYAFRQSFDISVGFTHQGPAGQENVDSLKTTKLGFGIKFSIIRPRWSQQTRNGYQRLIQAQRALMDEAENHASQNNSNLIRKRELLRNLAAIPNRTPAEEAMMQGLMVEIQLLTENAGDIMNADLATNSSAYQAAKQAALEIRNERKGAFLDFAGGFAFNFPDNRLGTGKLYRGGAWLTGGYEGGNSGFTALAIARYLYNPESLFALPTSIYGTTNVSTLDAGVRLLYAADGGKFDCGAEALYRSMLNWEGIPASWRLVVNAGYDIGVNHKLTFTFGKDFDGAITRGGNLIAALNLILGFGGERKTSGTTK